jgi:peptidoglycan lytic transglycosylase
LHSFSGRRVEKRNLTGARSIDKHPPTKDAFMASLYCAKDSSAVLRRCTKQTKKFVTLTPSVGRRGYKLEKMFWKFALATCAASLVLIVAANAETGIASIYSYEGRQTASGESAQPGVLSGAHRTLAFGTRVRVTNMRNGKTVVVRINDRGPFIAGRVIDLTPAGAHVLDFTGLTPVSLEVLK